MNGVWVVLRREYLARVRSRWFLASTIGLPLLLVGVIGLQVVLATRSAGRDRTVAIVDSTGRLHQQVAESLERTGYTVVASSASTEDLAQQVEDGDIAGYLVLDEETMTRGRVVYRGEDEPSRLRGAAMQSAVVQAAMAERMGGQVTSDDLETLLRGGTLEFESLSDTDPAEKEVGYGVGFAGAMVLYITLLIYGIAVMRAVLEEKTSRIVEVVISSIRPWQLMLGKIVGVGLVGLTQIAVWGVALTLMALFGVPALIAARPEMGDLQNVMDALPGVGIFLLFGVYFVLGFLLYSSLYAAVGAMCNNEEEAQQAQMPVTVLVAAPVFVLSALMNGGDSALAAGLSFVPFFAPILMFARAAAGVAPAWQILASLGLMVLAIWAVAWVAGRIYRVGILMQGKRPTLPELVRWIRAG